ncbi:MAG TPA: VWA domain-containing protein [Acidimicrobiales bacterium]|nr:VWA domain-containing protein [Acidimicrobiales bacterium]
MNFSASTYQNEFLPSDATEVHAVVTVTATNGEATASTSPEKAVVLIVDTSGSMGQPSTKIRAARQALAASVEELPDGTWFAVISGSHEAMCVYPPTYATGEPPSLVRADAMTRAEAGAVARQLRPEGGTAIGTWLDMARDVFAGHPDAIKLAYLLTDGRNESEPHRNLEAALQRCTGVFQCDARGVGSDWEVSELRLVTSTLLGEVDIIADPDEMDDDFRAFLERALGKAVADVRLRIWAPQGSTIKFVRQVAPTIDDLTAKATPVNPLTGDFPTGAWAGDESRDYHLCVNVPVGKVGDEKLAARVSLVVDDQPVSQALVKAIWTDDHALTARISPQVAHYTGQAELASAIHEGLEARKQGDNDTATVRLGRAVQLAHESGNEGTVKLLQKVVEVDDPATGTVRLKRGVAAVDEMALDTRSTRTVRVTAKPAAPSDPATPAPGSEA